METLIHFKQDMKTITKAWLKNLKDKKQELKERLVGLWYSMENQKVEFVKAQNNVHAIEVALLKQKEDQTNNQN